MQVFLNFSSVVEFLNLQILPQLLSNGGSIIHYLKKIVTLEIAIVKLSNNSKSFLYSNRMLNRNLK